MNYKRNLTLFVGGCVATTLLMVTGLAPLVVLGVSIYTLNSAERKLTKIKADWMPQQTQQTSTTTISTQTGETSEVVPPVQRKSWFSFFSFGLFGGGNPQEPSGNNRKPSISNCV